MTQNKVVWGDRVYICEKGSDSNHRDKQIKTFILRALSIHILNY